MPTCESTRPRCRRKEQRRSADAMQYRRIGSAGIAVSAIGLGSWLTFGETLDEAATRRCVDAALAAGINFFDTADVYGNGEAERLLGRVLSGISGSRYVIATKCFFPMGAAPNERGLSRKHVIEACNASLRRLGCEHIDLYQCHRFDPDVPLEETAAAMTSLIEAGKVLYWGFSQWPAEAIHNVMRLAGVHPISDQARYSMLDRDIENGILDACREHRLGVLAYSPLAQGVLTGKYSGGSIPEGSRAASPRTARAIEWRLNADHLAKAKALEPIAADLGVSLPLLALAWCLREPAVASVIIGASRPEQIEANAQAVEIQIPAEALERIEKVLA